MNYIKEMNTLYDRQEQTPISGSAIALWSALMNINNKTGWKNTFTSPASVLHVKAGLTESSFKRARAELERVGYIEVVSQGRGKAPMYRMHSLVTEWGEESEAEENPSVRCAFIDGIAENRSASEGEVEARMSRQMVASSNQVGNHPPAQPVSREVDSVSPQQVTEDMIHVANDLPPQQMNQEVTHVPAHQADHLPNHHPTHLPDQEPAPLVKQYNTKQKQNKTKTAAADAREQIFSGTENKWAGQKPDAILFYQENFGMAGPFVAESLLDWIDSLGEGLVVEAMKRALEQNKTSWSYVKSILNAWYKKGIRMVDQARAEQVAFVNERREKRGKRQAFGAVREDIVPDWYEAEKERQRKEREREEARDPEEEKRMRERVEEMLREFGG